MRSGRMHSECGGPAPPPSAPEFLDVSVRQRLDGAFLHAGIRCIGSVVMLRQNRRWQGEAQCKQNGGQFHVHLLMVACWNSADEGRPMHQRLTPLKSFLPRRGLRARWPSSRAPAVGSGERSPSTMRKRGPGGVFRGQHRGSPPYQVFGQSLLRGGDRAFPRPPHLQGARFGSSPTSRPSWAPAARRSSWMAATRSGELRRAFPAATRKARCRRAGSPRPICATASGMARPSSCGGSTGRRRASGSLCGLAPSARCGAGA